MLKWRRHLVSPFCQAISLPNSAQSHYLAISLLWFYDDDDDDIFNLLCWWWYWKGHLVSQFSLPNSALSHNLAISLLKMTGGVPSALTDSASPLDQPTLHCTIIMHKKSPGTCYWISLCKEVDLGGGGRPLSVPFLLLTSGKSQSQAGLTRRGAIFQISLGEAPRPLPLLYVRWQREAEENILGFRILGDCGESKQQMKFTEPPDKYFVSCQRCTTCYCVHQQSEDAIAL